MRQCRSLSTASCAELNAVTTPASVINISSIQGLAGFTFYGAYVWLMRTAAKKVANVGIRVNVMPSRRH
jgi:hypothetical protein